MTGPQGGVWVPLGGQLKAIWERALPGVTVQPLPGAGVANARGVDERRVEVGFGNSIRVHTGAITAAPFVDLDCDPPSTNHACDPTNTLYNGAILPTPSGARILAAPYDYPTQSRKLYAIDVKPDHTVTTELLPLTPDPCTTCTILAVIVRDLDGDHQPDIVAIDTNLSLDVAFSTVDPTLHVFQRFTPMTPLAGDTPMNNLRASVSGAPR